MLSRDHTAINIPVKKLSQVTKTRQHNVKKFAQIKKGTLTKSVCSTNSFKTNHGTKAVSVSNKQNLENKYR